jgi:acetate kinase
VSSGWQAADVERVLLGSQIMATDPVILCMNAGSSSLKVALFRLTLGDEIEIVNEVVKGEDSNGRIETALDNIKSKRWPTPNAVGHRLAHGGPHHDRPERIDAALLSSLRLSVPYAPLHLPSEIRAIDLVADRWPRIPQVACFDTGFHRDLPEMTRRLPLPWNLYQAGIRRYGFHGLSYEYVVEALGTDLGARAILAHLGSGSSMVALKDRQPIDTTMGLTPAGGFMMATRSGDLDPGVIFHLLDLGYSPRDLDRMLNHEAGLLGVSGSSCDMKGLLARSDTDRRAALAVEMFCYQAAKSVGSLAVALGGVDSLVFTGGIGQHAAPIRDRICGALRHLGVFIDAARNERAERIISTDDSPCVVRVVATSEELTIARHVRRAVFAC